MATKTKTKTKIIEHEMPQQLAAAQLPVPAAVAENFITMCERAATNPRIDVKKMQAILVMQREVIAYQAEVAYSDAMCDCQAAIPQIEAESQNKSTNSKYAKLEAIDKVIRPIIAKFGFSLSFDTRTLENGNKEVICTVRHRQGHKEKHQLDGAVDDKGFKGSANKTGIQGAGSTVSYLQRYITKLIFNVVIRGEDVDGNREQGGQNERREDDFASRVKTEETDDGAWDGNSVMVKGKRMLVPGKEFDLAATCTELERYLAAEQTKKARIDIINENLPLIRALAKAGKQSVIDGLHATADKGK